MDFRTGTSERTVAARRAVVVLRVWGVWRGLLLAVAMGIGMHLSVGTYVSLPLLEDHVQLLALIPGFAAMVIAFPLVDQTPFLTTMSPRSPFQPALWRVAGVLMPGLVLFAALATTPWSIREALAVFALLAGSILCAAVCGRWYWAPMTILALFWIQRFGISYDPRDREVEPLWTVLAVLLASGVYLWSQRHASDGSRRVRA